MVAAEKELTTSPASLLIMYTHTQKCHNEEDGACLG